MKKTFKKYSKSILSNKNLRASFKRHYLKIIAFTLPLISTLFFYGYQNPVDDLAQAFANKFAASETSTRTPPIAILTINDSSGVEQVSEWGYRNFLACMANIAANSGAKSVGLDLRFDRHLGIKNNEDKKRAENTKRLLNDDRIILSSSLRQSLVNVTPYERAPGGQVRPSSTLQWGISDYETLPGEPARTLTPVFKVTSRDNLESLVPSFSSLIWSKGSKNVSRAELFDTERTCLDSCVRGADYDVFSKTLGIDSALLRGDGRIRLRFPSAKTVFSVTSIDHQFSIFRDSGCEQARFLLPSVEDKFVLIGESFIETDGKLDNPLSFNFHPLPFQMLSSTDTATWPSSYFHAFSIWNHIHSFPLATQNVSAIISVSLFYVISLFVFFRVIIFLKNKQKYANILNYTSTLTVVFFLIFLLIAFFLDSYLISRTNTSIQSSQFIIFLPIVFACCLPMVFLLASRQRSPSYISLSTHLIYPEDQESLENLHLCIGEKLNAFVVKFPFRINQAQNYEEIQGILARGPSLIRQHDSISQSEILSKIKSRLGNKIYISNTTEHGLYLFVLIDFADAELVEEAEVLLSEFKASVNSHPQLLSHFKNVELSKSHIIVMLDEENSQINFVNLPR